VKTLLFGGSFNPAHIGHFILAEEARWRLGCDRVLFIPAFQPPHKKLDTDPGPEVRFAMLRAACEGLPGMEASDCELRRGGASYTIDTVRELRRNGTLDEPPFLLVGDDLLEGFSRWREADTLARETQLVLAHRLHSERQPFDYPHRYLDNLLIPVSSSLVRERIAEKGAWRQLVPAPVAGCIEREGLYGYR
jgi:nicotinate-nucleotide adenylyltransferase